MSTWTPQDWAIFLGAVGALIAAIASSIGAIYSAMAKAQGDINEKKIDTNTEVTVAGTSAAATNAAAAASTANEVKEAAKALSHQMNGALDERIERVVERQVTPLIVSLNEHKANVEAAIRDMSNKIK